jgi:hypothetical protein
MPQNYKDTLNLPRTDFPMKANLAQREPALLKDGKKPAFIAKFKSHAKTRSCFVLHDGPPFANGDVHMGTALNKILKDFVVKSQTMLGKRAPYVPGWDCHGLPIEYKVVKESRDLAPLEVRKRCEAFAASSSISSASNSNASAFSAIGNIPTSPWIPNTKPRSCAPLLSSSRKVWFTNQKNRFSGAQGHRPPSRKRKWNIRNAMTPPSS